MAAKRRLMPPLSLAEAKQGDAFEVTFDEDVDAFVFRRVTTKVDWLEVLAE